MVWGFKDDWLNQQSFNFTPNTFEASTKYMFSNVSDSIYTAVIGVLNIRME